MRTLRNLNKIIRSWIVLLSTCLYTVNVGGERSAVRATLPEQPRHQHHDWGGGPESIKYWMVYGRPGFLDVVWFGSSPPPPPISKLDWRDTRRLRKRDNLQGGDGGEGGGGAKNHRMARKPGPLNYSILFVCGVAFFEKTAFREVCLRCFFEMHRYAYYNDKHFICVNFAFSFNRKDWRELHPFSRIYTICKRAGANLVSTRIYRYKFIKPKAFALANGVLNSSSALWLGH